MKDNEFKTLDQLEAELEAAKKQYEDAQKSVTKKKAEEADRKKAELDAEKNKRKKEIEEAKNHYCALIKQYIADYGSYTYESEDDDNFNFLFGSKPWRFFL